jgi:hypothetical protein
VIRLCAFGVSYPLDLQSREPVAGVQFGKEAFSIVCTLLSQEDGAISHSADDRWRQVWASIIICHSAIKRGVIVQQTGHRASSKIKEPNPLTRQQGPKRRSTCALIALVARLAPVLPTVRLAPARARRAAHLPNLDGNHRQVGSDESRHSDVHRHDTSPFAGMAAGDGQVVDALKVYAR